METTGQKKELLKDFLTVKEASEMLCVSEFTLRKYLRNNIIKGYKKFNKWFVFSSDLKDFIKKSDKPE